MDNLHRGEVGHNSRHKLHAHFVDGFLHMRYLKLKTVNDEMGEGGRDTGRKGWMAGERGMKERIREKEKEEEKEIRKKEIEDERENEGKRGMKERREGGEEGGEETGGKTEGNKKNS